jgi:hypothetical protein
MQQVSSVDELAGIANHRMFDKYLLSSIQNFHEISWAVTTTPEAFLSYRGLSAGGQFP